MYEKTATKAPLPTFPPQDVLTPCTQPGSNAADWDYPNCDGEDTLARTTQACVKAQQLCGHCPLLQECARYALSVDDTVWTDIVIAGIPISHLSAHRQRRTAQAALTHVAAGGSLDEAHAIQQEDAALIVEQRRKSGTLATHVRTARTGPYTPTPAPAPHPTTPAPVGAS